MKQVLFIAVLGLSSLTLAQGYSLDSEEGVDQCGHIQMTRYAYLSELKNSAGTTTNLPEFLEKFNSAIQKIKSANAVLKDMGCPIGSEFAQFE
jgi:hypothetical protein